MPQAKASDPETLTHSTVEPDNVLLSIRLSKENAIYLLKDFHPYLENPKTVRKLRDLATELKSSYKTVILLSPVRKIPVELEKEVAILTFPLPAD